MDALSTFLGLQAPLCGLPSGRPFVVANLCKICLAIVFLLSLVSGVFVFPATFATGLAALVGTSGIFFSNFYVSAGSLDAFSVGFAGLSNSLGVPFNFPSAGGCLSTGAGSTSG